jgi:hypothetical protein
MVFILVQLVGQEVPENRELRTKAKEGIFIKFFETLNAMIF